MTALLFKSIKQVKKLIISVIGFTVLLIGLAMVVLPGPAFIVIPIGLGILATEFVWAKSLLRRIKSSASNVKERVSKQ
ncbi:MAG: PGPGW domain-containing protein [Thermodesulfovibrionales bacterium]